MEPVTLTATSHNEQVTVAGTKHHVIGLWLWAGLPLDTAAWPHAKGPGFTQNQNRNQSVIKPSHARVCM
jgi:hypothetical protein